MRILHIGSELFWRGGENQIRLLVEGLGAHGVSSYVAYPARSRGYSTFVSSLNGSPTGGPLSLRGVLALPSRSPLDPRNVIRLVRYCQEHKIEVLDANSSVAMGWALLVKHFLPHLKLVVHRRIDISIRNSWLTKRKYMSPKIDQFVCISNAIQKNLIQYGVLAQKISVVRSAIQQGGRQAVASEVLKSELRSRYRLSDNSFLLGCAAALSGQKGHETLIEACQLLVQKKLNFHCFIAGEGPAEAELKALMQAQGLERNMTFLGHVQDTTSLLRSWDALVLPSRNEGLGTILLEGALAGCTLVGSRVGGIPEVILDEKTGLLFEVGDARGLADRVDRLITDSKYRTSLAEAARAHVEKEFSLAAMVDGNFAVYKKLNCI